MRNHFLPKTTIAMSKKYAFAVMGNLKMGIMLCSVSETLDTFGRSIRAMAGMNKFIFELEGKFQ